MSQPTKRTAEMRHEILECLREGLSLRSTAACCEVDPTFIRDWRIDDASFATQLKKAVADGERALATTVRTRAEGWQANAWMLSRRFPEKWGKKREEHKPAGTTVQLDAATVTALTKASEELRKK